MLIAGFHVLKKPSHSSVVGDAIRSNTDQTHKEGLCVCVCGGGIQLTSSARLRLTDSKKVTQVNFSGSCAANCFPGHNDISGLTTSILINDIVIVEYVILRLSKG